MHYVHVGSHKLVQLELEPDVASGIAQQAGFECKANLMSRALVLDLTAPDRQTPLLLFDAGEAANLGWFSRCQFYVDGLSGAVLQTPIFLANQRDQGGRVVPNAVRVSISTELPAGYRMPGKQPVNEQLVYAVLYNLLHALLNVGVGLCGAAVVKPLAGRSEGVALRNQ